MVSSSIHGTSYSYIAVQAAYLATYFPSVYWNTAYLRVVSGLDEDAASNYDKIAKGIGDVQKHGTKVELIDINKSQYMFEPEEETNSILYGLKAVSGITADLIDDLIDNRPYVSFSDFQDKIKCNKTMTIALIKSGAFDGFAPREEVMKEYLTQTCGTKKRLTMQNFNGLCENNLIPSELDFQKRVFIFNKALKKDKKSGDYFILDYNYYDFYTENFDIDLLEIHNDMTAISQKNWKKIYDNVMSKAKSYITKNNSSLLDALNNKLLQSEWNKYAFGNLSSWEMDSLGYYYHDHELKNVSYDLYNIMAYKNLPFEPEVERTYKRNGREFPIFKTCRIIGTVISKDLARSQINVLTPESGVVTIKFDKNYFARLNRRISDDTTGKVVENGWFSKGTLIVVNGFRRGDTFVSRKYGKNSHQCYRITNVNNDGTINMVWQRWGEQDNV